MTPLEVAIIKTLAYADIFNHELTSEELQKLLISHPLTDDAELKRFTSKHVRYANGLFHLATKASPADHENSKRQLAHNKITHAKKYLLLFKLIPWIKMVGITGSIAGGTPRYDDDIDLLIITDSNRLWLTRLLLTLSLNLLGKRRKPQADPRRVNNKFCLNMWLSSENLVEKHQDIYTANELARIIPILDRQYMYKTYLQANSWMTKFLPNFNQTLFQTTHTDLNSQKPSLVLDLAENLAERLQKAIMHKPTIETIESNRLAFHPYDYRTEIVNKYQQKLQSFGLSD
jgi:predicted nucleotidyltransferase